MIIYSITREVWTLYQKRGLLTDEFYKNKVRTSSCLIIPQDKTGKWHDISSDPGMITINNGDMLAMASENFFPSTPHRVINPEGKKNNSRYSIPMFLHPIPDVKWSNVLSAESYLQNRLKEIGLK